MDQGFALLDGEIDDLGTVLSMKCTSIYCDTLRALHSRNVFTTSMSEGDIICLARSQVQGPWPEEGSWHDLREHMFPEHLHVVAMIAALSLAVLVHLCTMLHLLQLQSRHSSVTKFSFVVNEQCFLISLWLAI
ncbi:hypothetical protein SADUNF_Sadunf16G0134400 [Salix dunnii]|uniref:Uncharacterized protein n=1 Tax=Salix dunnii TaxID=1413687 RepID=A0A835J8N0_9ROSI|nr:hypothetical protein SADUNF_Sadunf16G0134400 [Salix dunnii]